MTYDPARHHRRSIRLKSYDYSQAAAYFVTICTQNRACLFGDIVNGEMRLNEWGLIVSETWEWLPTQYVYVELDEWVVMPNHLHGIVIIHDARGCRGGSRGCRGGSRDCRGGSRDCRGGSRDCRGGSRTAPTDAVKRKPLGRLVGAFKTVSTKRINEKLGTPGARLWQRNYYEHIIRDEESLNRIRQYIRDNPLRWAMDRENPDAIKPEPKEAWQA